MHHGIVAEGLLFLGIAVIVTPLCLRLRVSPILGYLLAGSLVGPFGMGLLDDSEGSRALAELGIVFLLFMIGLELSFDRLRVIRHFIFGLGSAQVAVTAAAVGGAAWALGLAPEAALIVGLALAFSSTAFVLQILSERGGLGSQSGRVSVAVLILQDLAVVPLLVMIPLLAEDRGAVLPALGLASLKAALALAVILGVGRLALKPLFQVVAATHSTEVFIAAALLSVIGTATVTEAAGLSYSLGAFLAGVMLASTEYRHQIEADLQPLRGLLMGLFFLTVGMTVDLQGVLSSLHQVVAGVAALVAVKAGLLVLLARLFRFPWALAINVGLLLAQGGEFAFVVLTRAVEADLLRPGLAEWLTAVIALSMALTPALALAGERVIHWRALRDGQKVAPRGETDDLRDHVIIIGFGRVGRTVAAILKSQGVPYVAIDREPHTVGAGRHRGEPVFFGDIRKLEVLRAVGAERARAVVLTIGSGSQREHLVPWLRRRFPDLRVLVRARDRRQQKHLEAVGAHAVVPEAQEGSLQLAGLVLRTLGSPSESVSATLEHYRGNDYAALDEATGRLMPPGSSAPD